MKIKVVVHEAEEGGFWAEVPAIPGCATQGETMDELMRNLHEAIESAAQGGAPSTSGQARRNTRRRVALSKLPPVRSDMRQ